MPANAGRTGALPADALPADSAAIRNAMDGKPGLFNLLGKRMEWLGQRQKVLAQNIANADTPDYVPHDLKPQEFRRIVERHAAATLQPAAPRPGHVQRSAEHPSELQPLMRNSHV